MGQSASKPETKVFTPATPVEFSASFLAQLDNSVESDYTRSQYTEKYIQERVAQELKKLEIKALENFQNSTTESLSKYDSSAKNENSTSTRELETKLTELSKKLKDQESNIVKVTDNILSSRQKVVNCLKENKGKPLNCWDEAEEFKKLVNQL